MKCENCGHQNPANAKFCENCGQPLIEKTVSSTQTCPNCGEINDSHNKFCEKCGFDLRKQQSAEKVEPVVARRVTKSKPEKQSLADRFIEKDESIATPSSENISRSEQSMAAGSNQQDDHSQNTSTKSTDHSAITNTSAVSGSQPVENRRTGRSNNQEKHRHTGLWIIALLVLIVAAGGSYYFYRHQQNKQIAVSRVAKESSSKSVAEKQSRSESKAASKSKAEKESSAKKSELNFTTSDIDDLIGSTIGQMSGVNSVYVSPADSSKTVIENNQSQRSASSIKVFIMAAAYQMAEAGTFDMSGVYTVQASDKVGGTGVLQSMANGTQLTNQELIRHMIIDRLGGLDAVNQEIEDLGATDTSLNRKLMDQDALNAGRDNMTSVKDLGMVMKRIYNQKLISKDADQNMLAILAQNNNHTKLPAKLPATIKVYNKTGEYDEYGVQNDAAVFETNKGALVVVVLSQDGEHDEQLATEADFGESLYEQVFQD